MPAGVITKSTTFGGAGTNPNQLSGSQFALITEPSVVSVGVVMTAAAGSIAINCGNRIITESGTVPPVVAANVMPIIPDNFFYTFPALPGEQIQIALVATGAVTFNTVVQIATA